MVAVCDHRHCLCVGDGETGTKERVRGSRAEEDSVLNGVDGVERPLFYDGGGCTLSFVCSGDACFFYPLDGGILEYINVVHPAH